MIAHKYFKITDHTLDSYCTIAAENIDPEIQYFYAALLAEKNKNSNAVPLLKDITSQNGPYAKNAQFDLMLIALNANPENETTKASIKKKLPLFIKSVKNTNPSLHTEATRLCCRLLLDSPKPDCARQALGLINQIEKPLKPKNYRGYTPFCGAKKIFAEKCSFIWLKIFATEYIYVSSIGSLCKMSCNSGGFYELKS